MNALEVNVFLTKAALLDPRMKRVDPRDQADMAEAWAEVLDDVPLTAAVAALRAHYRESSYAITPADVMRRVVLPPDPVFPDITAQFEADSKRAALAAAGVTEAEWEVHSTDREWLLEHFPQHELEAGR